MTNNSIISRIENMQYLGRLKGHNVSAITKKREFHDVVKFYAQINTENRVQKISFQATGCSAFMAMCSYFCEVVEGMKVSSALKVAKEDLEKVANVTLSNDHVYPIIFDTFALLIKKYNKGVSDGSITPLEVSNDSNNSDKKESKIKRDDNKSKKSPENKTDNTKSKKEEKPLKTAKSASKNTKVDSKTKDSSKTGAKKITKAVDNKGDKKSSKDDSQPLNVQPVQKPQVLTADQPQVIKVIEIKEEVKVRKTGDDVVEMETTKKTNEIHLGHLSSLQEKIKTKQIHEKEGNSSVITYKEDRSNTSNDDIVIIEDDVETPKKQKKSLFSWFKKKKH